MPAIQPARRPTPPPVQAPQRSKSRGKNPWDVLPGTQNEERVGPFLFPFVWALVGVGFNRWAETFPGGLAALVALTVVTGGGLAWWAWAAAHGRHSLVRWHIAVSIGFQFGTLAAWTVFGATRPFLDLYAWLQLAWAASWIVPTFAAVRGYGTDSHDGMDPNSPLAKALDGISNARVVRQSEDGNRQEIDVDHAGLTTKDVQNRARTLESLFGLRSGALTPFRHPSKRGDKTRIMAVAEDTLERGVKWAPPSPEKLTDEGRRSIAEGLPVGHYQDGVQWRVFLSVMPDKYLENLLKRSPEIRDLMDDLLPRPPKGAPHRGWQPSNLQVAGTSRSGKSRLFLLIVAALMECNDVAPIWLSDTIKGPQTLGPILPAVDVFVDNKNATSAMFRAVDRIIRYRTGWLGDRQFEAWEPGCGLPFLIVWVEEAARTADMQIFVRLQESALSAGIAIVNSMQRPSFDNIPTSARANIQSSIQLGLIEEGDETFTLPKWILESGAGTTLREWGTSMPGASFYAAPMLSPQRQVTPERTWDTERAALTAFIAEHAHRMHPLDQGSIDAATANYEGGQTVNVFEKYHARRMVTPGPVTPAVTPAGDTSQWGSPDPNGVTPPTRITVPAQDQVHGAFDDDPDPDPRAEDDDMEGAFDDEDGPVPADIPIHVVPGNNPTKEELMDEDDAEMVVPADLLEGLEEADPQGRPVPAEPDDDEDEADLSPPPYVGPAMTRAEKVRHTFNAVKLEAIENGEPTGDDDGSMYITIRGLMERVYAIPGYRQCVSRPSVYEYLGLLVEYDLAEEVGGGNRDGRMKLYPLTPDKKLPDTFGDTGWFPEISDMGAPGDTR